MFTNPALCHYPALHEIEAGMVCHHQRLIHVHLSRSRCLLDIHVEVEGVTPGTSNHLCLGDVHAAREDCRIVVERLLAILAVSQHFLHSQTIPHSDQESINSICICIYICCLTNLRRIFAKLNSSSMAMLYAWSHT